MIYDAPRERTEDLHEAFGGAGGLKVAREYKSRLAVSWWNINL
jgi:hypothetical protein